MTDYYQKAIEFNQYYEKGCLNEAMDHFMTTGNCKMVKFLYKVGIDYTEEQANLAASKGFLNIIQYLKKFSKLKCTVDAIDCASINGDLKMVQLLYKSGLQPTEFAFDNACLLGKSNIIHFLCKIDCPYTENALENAVFNNHLKIVKYLVFRGFKPTEYAREIAKKNDNQEIIVLLK
jgi:hypothetical protein